MSTIEIRFLRSLFTLFLTVSFLISSAQETEDSRYEEVLGLTRFYEYMLNTLGSASTAQRDKDIIISESYTKAFASRQVQVEDDLLDDRKVITNKDIHAYLRDVDFFFQNVTFKFDSIKISQEKKPNDEVFYLVSFEKTIEGTTLEGLPIRKIQNRFLEINIDEEISDLKIVSVYTTKISREKELRDWYNTLSFGWLNVFDQYVTYDSVTPEVLHQIVAIDSINLSENQFLRNISPLVALKNLKYINVSGTSIEDLSPIRYSASIRTIIANNSLVKDLSALQYFDNVQILELRKSRVMDISHITKLMKLERLDLSGTEIPDFTPIAPLQSLRYLDLSETICSNLSFLSNLEKLRSLNVSQTKVTDLSPVANLAQLISLDVSETSLLNLAGLDNHPSLEILNISQTLVNSLEPIENLRNLKKVEADLSDIPDNVAVEYMETHPAVVVVVNSKALRNWWDGLSSPWKEVFKNEVGFEHPTKEDLIHVTKIDSLDLSNMAVSSLVEPLSPLKKLRYLNVSNNPITSFDFAGDMINLEVLIAENTAIERIEKLPLTSPLSQISLKGTPVYNIASLLRMNSLEFINLDQTEASEDQIKELVKTNPKATILWRSEELQTWWSSLDESWKNAFKLSNPTSIELHHLTHLTKIELSGMALRDFRPLKIFLNIQEIHLDQVGILNFNELNVHSGLVKLSCINGPLQSVEGLSGLTLLQELIISNTPVEDLQGLAKNTAIKRLDCSGTNIKRLKGLENMKTIEYLNISNTNVFKLDRIFGLSQLKELVCFNTRLRQFEVDEFQEKFPDCKILYY